MRQQSCTGGGGASPSAQFSHIEVSGLCSVSDVLWSPCYQPRSLGQSTSHKVTLHSSEKNGDGGQPQSKHSQRQQANAAAMEQVLHLVFNCSALWSLGHAEEGGQESLQYLHTSVILLLASGLVLQHIPAPPQ